MATDSARQMILCADPQAQYLAHKDEIDFAISRVLKSGWYILGEEVKAFEREFAEYVGVKHCTGVANGTDALVLALKACGIGAGDEVITVSHSAVATAAAIELAGAVPVFVDIEKSSRCIDPALINAMISAKTRAIVPVHIYGQPCDMAAIMAIAARHNLKVIEDCAQAHGARIDGDRVGTFGHAAAFSFYPTKNLGAIGDGGGVVTNSPDIYERLQLLRQYGWKERYVSAIQGGNSRLDELQAAVLRVKLQYLEEDNEKRRKIAAVYNRGLSGRNIEAPRNVGGTTHAMHLYVLECQNRDALKSYLQERGVQAALHYPMAIHEQPAYRNRIRGGNTLRETEALYRRILSLPMYPELPLDRATLIAGLVQEWADGQSKRH